MKYISKRLTNAAFATIGILMSNMAFGSILTFGCANTNVSCTLEELTRTVNPGSFIINNVTFRDFSTGISSGTENIVVTPIKQDQQLSLEGGINLPWLGIGFDLNFNPAFSVNEKGRQVDFGLVYTVSASQSPLDGMIAQLHVGAIHGAGDTARASLSASVFTSTFSESLAIACLGTSSCENTNNNPDPATGRLFSSEAPLLEVFENVSLLIDDFTGGNDPHIEVLGFSNVFFVIPEPASLLLMTPPLLLLTRKRHKIRKASKTESETL